MTTKKKRDRSAYQQEWQKKRQQAGLCIVCGKTRERLAWYCDDCVKGVYDGHRRRAREAKSSNS